MAALNVADFQICKRLECFLKEKKVVDNVVVLMLEKDIGIVGVKYLDFHATSGRKTSSTVNMNPQTNKISTCRKFYT